MTLSQFSADHDVPVLDASTLILMRDGRDGPEVCMLQRNLNSDFVGGAYVFPGGAVDPADGSADALALCSGRDDSSASAMVGRPRAGLALWVAAVRESFEEAGLLLARDSDGQVVSFAGRAAAQRFARHRLRVDRHGVPLAEVLGQEGLRIDAAELHYHSRWVTPTGSPRRYDTRFFIALAPEEQVATHDQREVIGTRWITPAAALDEHEAGRMTLIFPTVRTLVALSEFTSAESAVAAASVQREVPRIEPTMTISGDAVQMFLPGDPEGTGGLYDAMTGAVVEP